MVLVFNPVLAIKITFFFFALAGYFGFYFLLKRKFRINQPFALLGATLFLFNGFYAHRMMIGHPFHAFMLLPWLAISLLPAPIEPPESLKTSVYRIACAGAIIAYMFHSAMMHIIPPAILAITAILVVYSFLYGKQRIAWIRLGAAIGLALGLCSSKLVGSLSFLQQFPRDEYALPGFPSLWAEFRVVLLSLFWRPPAEHAQSLLANVSLPLERHEWEYGLGPAAALLLLAGAVRVAKRARLAGSAWLVTVAIGVALALPLALNWHHPAWHAFLKSQPLLGSSSNLVRAATGRAGC